MGAKADFVFIVCLMFFVLIDGSVHHSVDRPVALGPSSASDIIKSMSERGENFCFSLVLSLFL